MSIISINLGQFGSRIGHLFNQSVAQEHCLVSNQQLSPEQYAILRSKIGVYFDCTTYQKKLHPGGITTSEIVGNNYCELQGTDKYLSRSIFVDSERDCLERILATPGQDYGLSKLHEQHPELTKTCSNQLDIRSLYTQEQFLMGSGRPITTFAEGLARTSAQNEEANTLFDKLMEQIRKKAEQSDQIQGFQLCFSTAGGMSGVAASILQELGSHYDECKKFCMVQHPSSAFCSNSCINIYNDILSTNSLIEDADIVGNADDHSLLQVCSKRILPMTNYQGVKIEQQLKPSWQDANNLFVDSILGISQNFRLPTSQNQNLLKLVYSLIPYPRFSLFSVSQTFDMRNHPLELQDHQFNNLMHGMNMLHSSQQGNLSTAFSAVNEQVRPGIHLTSQLDFRSANSMVQCCEKYYKEFKSDHYTSWLGCNTMTSYPRFDDTKLPSSQYFGQKVTLFELNLKMEDFLRERQTLFRTALSRKLFFHRFQKFGMDEMQFTEAENAINELVSDYSSIQQIYQDEAEFGMEALNIQTNNGMQVNLDIGDLDDSEKGMQLESDDGVMLGDLYGDGVMSADLFE